MNRRSTIKPRRPRSFIYDGETWTATVVEHAIGWTADVHLYTSGSHPLKVKLGPLGSFDAIQFELKNLGKRFEELGASLRTRTLETPHFPEAARGA